MTRQFAPPLVRVFRDGALHITDAAVITDRDRVRAAHEAGWATRRAPLVAKAKVIRAELGL